MKPSFTSTNTAGSSTTKSNLKTLPIRIKQIISPTAKIKSDRRDNYLYRHSKDQVDTNLLIFFHGAGDTHIPFHNLAKQMALPQTATLSLSASSFDKGFVTLPFGLGYTWFHEMDYSTGDHYKYDDDRRISSLNQAAIKLDTLIDALCVNPDDEKTDIEQGWIPERIFLFGFSSGACIAMQICFNRLLSGKRPLGGAVCVAGGIPRRIDAASLILQQSCNHTPTAKADGKPIESTNTPILIMAGSNDEKYSPSEAKHSVDAYSKHAPYNAAEVHVECGKKHTMIQSPNETRVMMEFFAKRLTRRMIAMEGWTELHHVQS